MSPRTLKREHNGFSHDCCTPKYLVNQEVTNEKQLQKMTDQERERINWAGRILGLPDVWRLTQGEGVKVAILDTGIDTDHPDLKEAIIASKDFSGDGIEDVDGHGTHCAGIVGARLNGVGFVGVAPKSQLMIGKVLSNNGSGPYSWLVEGIYWAVDNGAQIISMSLGGPSSDSELYKAIQYALYHGVFVICAAGNEGGYATLSGTSMATPFVAGLAALIASKHESSNSNNTPLLNNEDMRNHLLRMATHPGYHDNQAGYGPLQPFSYF